MGFGFRVEMGVMVQGLGLAHSFSLPAGESLKA